MQNSFEKQVKNKMDELQFVPTTPVWQKIEKQIRTKKDRRRLILWLPFLCLLLCGGIWWLSTANHSATNRIITINPVVNETEVATKNPMSTATTPKPLIETKKTTQPGEANDVIKQEIVNDKIEPAIIKRNYILNNDLSLLSKLLLPAKKTNKASGLASPKLMANEKVIASAGKDITASEELHQPVSKESSSKPFALKKADSSLQKTMGKKDSVVKYKVADVKVDTVDNAVAATKKSIRKSSKWKFGVLVNAGTSGIGKGLGSLSLNKSLDAMAVNSPATIPQNNNQNPSPVKNDLSFSIGFVARKKLSDRISFSAGMQYNYYSTNITVGKMRQDSAVYNYSLAQSFSRYYLNSGTSFKDYRNQYHFISLPVSIDWQMLKKVPLSIQAGLSLQQLVSTNALLYDAQNNIYFGNKSLFHKTQLFSNLGFSYAIINNEKTSMLIGPQMQYGISRLDKNGSAKHLFSLGITTQILFQKK
ncbi:MAG: hypothetical protein ACTHOF_04810 [Flavisolibacter sp.]|jgi:hypothetical protein